MRDAILKIGAVLVFCGLLFYLFNAAWSLELVAWLVLLACAIVGIAAGWGAYLLIDHLTGSEGWVKATMAIIFGITITLLAEEVVHSHRIVNAVRHYEPADRTDDDD